MYVAHHLFGEVARRINLDRPRHALRPLRLEELSIDVREDQGSQIARGEPMDTAIAVARHEDALGGVLVAKSQRDPAAAIVDAPRRSIQRDEVVTIAF